VEQSRQAVQRLVDIMTRDELLTQVENPKHKRAKYIKLTKKGQRVYEFLYIKQIEWAKGHLVNIEKAELETALVVLRKMTL
jgi:DNA-binding MarR family transcriptional regulator